MHTRLVSPCTCGAIEENDSDRAATLGIGRGYEFGKQDRVVIQGSCEIGIIHNLRVRRMLSTCHGHPAVGNLT